MILFKILSFRFKHKWMYIVAWNNASSTSIFANEFCTHFQSLIPLFTSSILHTSHFSSMCHQFVTIFFKTSKSVDIGVCIVNNNGRSSTAKRMYDKNVISCDIVLKKMSRGILTQRQSDEASCWNFIIFSLKRHFIDAENRSHAKMILMKFYLLQTIKVVFEGFCGCN